MMNKEDREEKYWSNLEKVYVHNVYENISSKYDEFLKLSRSRYYGSRDVEDNCLNLGDDQPQSQQPPNGVVDVHRLPTETQINSSSNNNNETIAGRLLKLELNGNNNSINNNNSNSSSKIKFKKQFNIKSLNNNNSRQSSAKNRHNAWPKVKQFLLQLDRYSLIGKKTLLS
jgi:hypothetical protein